jgi:hypothetical protein
VNLNSALQYAIANKKPNLKIIELIGKLAKGFIETSEIMTIACRTEYKTEKIRIEVLEKLLPLLFKPNKINHYSVKDIFPYAMVYIEFMTDSGRYCSEVCNYLLEVSTYMEPTNTECEILKFMMAMRKCNCPTYLHYFLMFCMHSSINKNDIQDLRLYEKIREKETLFLCMMRSGSESDEQLLFSQKIATKMFNLKLVILHPKAGTSRGFIHGFRLLFFYWDGRFREQRIRIFKLLELFWNFGLNFEELAMRTKIRFDSLLNKKIETLQNFICDMLLSFRVGYLFYPISTDEIIFGVHTRFRLRYGLKPIGITDGLILYEPYKEPSSLKEICRHTILAKTIANSNPLHRQTMVNYFYEVSLLDIPMVMKEFLKFR